jgi:hypothetical protein
LNFYAIWQGERKSYHSLAKPQTPLTTRGDKAANQDTKVKKAGASNGKLKCKCEASQKRTLCNCLPIAAEQR